MELEEYGRLIESRLKKNFDILSSYEGNEYDMVALKSEEVTKSLGNTCLNRTVFAISGLDASCDVSYCDSEIDSIPQILISGFRDIAKSKMTDFIRVFVMSNIPFEFIQKIRSYAFSKTERRNFDYAVNGGIILVDLESMMVYSSRSAAPYCNYFKVIKPVETKEDEQGNIEKQVEK